MNIIRKEIRGYKCRYYFLGIKVYTRPLRPEYEKAFRGRFKSLNLTQARIILETQFEASLGYTPDLEHPQTFNEKLQWLKLYYHNPLLTLCADKYKVREYVKEKIGEEYLVPMLGVWENAEDVDFDTLPNEFALKVNWGSGQNIICPDKSALNIAQAREDLKNWMRPEGNHYYNFLEWGYKNIEPKIIAETYLNASGLPVKDYKFFCFHGEPQFLYVATDSWDSEKTRISYFDMNMQQIDLTRRDYPNLAQDIAMPAMWDAMVEMARILAEPFPFVRVDFMQLGEKLYFGELTFCPTAGLQAFVPDKWDKIFGDHLILTEDLNTTTYQ